MKGYCGLAGPSPSAARILLRGEVMWWVCVVGKCRDPRARTQALLLRSCHLGKSLNFPVLQDYNTPIQCTCSENIHRAPRRVLPGSKDRARVRVCSMGTMTIVQSVLGAPVAHKGSARSNTLELQDSLSLTPGSTVARL